MLTWKYLWCLVFYPVQKTHVVASVELVLPDIICYISIFTFFLLRIKQSLSGNTVYRPKKSALLVHLRSLNRAAPNSICYVPSLTRSLVDIFIHNNKKCNFKFYSLDIWGLWNFEPRENTAKLHFYRFISVTSLFCKKW